MKTAVRSLFTWVIVAAASSAALAQPPSPPAAAQRLPMDLNNDGAVTADEHAVAARQVFERMDANHDGKATREEMIAFQQAVIRASQAAAPRPPAAAAPPQK